MEAPAMGLFDKQKPVQDETEATSLADRARIASFLYRARTFNGTGPEDPTLTITLRPGERALLVATGTFLVEPRRVLAHWAGTSGGFSFHVPQQAAQSQAGHAGPGGDLTPVDTGDLTFTDQRIVFAGSRQSREWEYSALLGFHHTDQPPWTGMAVSGQDRVSGFRYDEGQAGEIRFAIVLGLTRFHDALESLIADLQEQLDEFDRTHSTGGVSGPTPTWQTSTPASFPAIQETPSSPLGGVGQPVEAGSPGVTVGAAAGDTAWPPPSPFGAAPVGASPTQSGSGPVTWNADAALLAPTEPATNGADAEPAASTESWSTEPGSLQHESAEHVPTGVVPAWAVETAVQSELSPAAATPPEPEAATNQPATAEDTGAPTGEIPTVPLSPTATYPAVVQQPVSAVQTFQSAQPMQETQPQVQATAQTNPNTPPGWYPDPWRVARVRWWDGYSWTSYTSH
jgi:Protein of unknown function (DUF2510)